MKTITILGSTGSIGTQALEIASLHNINIKALSAHSNIELLEKQAREFDVSHVCIYDEKYFSQLKAKLSDTKIIVLCGMEGLCEIAELDGVDIMLNAVVGMVGLIPTIKAIEKGTDIALANKETLVAGGEIVMKLAADKNVKIFPVDSEHSAIFQCLQGNNRNQVSRIFLTASGGPFFGKTKKGLANVSVSQALNHPNWSMGKKITIDSATLMNKGLELIEAVHLFDLQPEQIEIVIHRESIIHSAVEYDDFSVIAQLGVPDMKIPIQYALFFPNRLACPTKRLSLIDYGKLTFFKPDSESFDCLAGCIKAIKMGGIAPAFINGVNEEAVARFLNSEISFLRIGELVLKALKEMKNIQNPTLDDILAADKMAREFVSQNIMGA